QDAGVDGVGDQRRDRARRQPGAQDVHRAHPADGHHQRHTHHHEHDQQGRGPGDGEQARAHEVALRAEAPRRAASSCTCSSSTSTSSTQRPGRELSCAVRLWVLV
ncbi:MAG: hypothetical protein ACK56I_28780, partial [bacterium]